MSKCVIELFDESGDAVVTRTVEICMIVDNGRIEYVWNPEQVVYEGGNGVGVLTHATVTLPDGRQWTTGVAYKEAA